MTALIKDLGGPSAVARALGIRAPSVIGWGGLPPAERCPALERAYPGRVTCEELRPDVRWVRVPDPYWPDHRGRPCIDVVGPTCGDGVEAGQAAP